jgi:hypothetical protein
MFLLLKSPTHPAVRHADAFSSLLEKRAESEFGASKAE